MLEFAELIPHRNFCYNEVLQAVRSAGDDWDAVQRFHFAAFRHGA